jgi:hypothetical protein
VVPELHKAKQKKRKNTLQSLKVTVQQSTCGEISNNVAG